MRKRSYSYLLEGEEDEINMTPMLDVVFIMLIFFIVSASFVKESGIDVKRPQAATAEMKEHANIIVAVNELGEIWINRRRVDEASVRANIERLHAENPKASLIVQADEHALVQKVVSVMDAARMAGVFDVSLATEPKK